MFRATRLAGAATLIAAALSGCGGSDEPATPEAVRNPTIEHIHGVTADADDTVFVATHDGLFAAKPSTTRVQRVGASEQDLMGFALAEPGRFIASGHPDARQDQPPHLGLIESDDGGRTWENVSLLGEADFHVLRTAGSLVYAYDGVQSRLMVSDDGGRTWNSRGAVQPIFDLAIDPRDPRRVVGATERGLYVSRNGGESWRPLDRDRSGSLAWTERHGLILFDSSGAVHRLGDAAWQQVGRLDAPPAAVAASGSALLAGLETGMVMRSDDGGRSWVLRARP